MTDNEKRLEEIRNHLYSTEVGTMLAVINGLLNFIDEQQRERKGRLEELLGAIRNLTAANAKVRRLIAGGHHQTGCDYLIPTPAWATFPTVRAECDCGWALALADTEEK